MQSRNVRVRKMVVLGLFAAMASVLMLIEIPLGRLIFPMAPFLQLDFSSVPIMIGSFMYGPVAGVAIAFVKSAIHLMITSTAGIGELVDFIITSSFAISAGLVYINNKSRKGALIATVVSVVITTIVAVLANYFIAVPLYSSVMNFNIEDIKGYLLLGIVPFNLIKGVAIGVVTFVMYKKLSHWIRNFECGEKLSTRTKRAG